MNCPYCKEKMQEGYIASERHIAFTTTNKEMYNGSLLPIEADEFQLGHAFQLGILAVTAFHCKNCKKIIVELDGNKAYDKAMSKK